MDKVKALVALLRAILAYPGVKSALRDLVEASIAAAASLTLTVPTNLGDAKKEAVVVSVAVLSAAIAVARRELLPIAKRWVMERVAGPLGL